LVLLPHLALGAGVGRVLEIAGVSAEKKMRSKLAGVFVTCFALVGLAIFLWVATTAEDDQSGVKDPEAAAGSDENRKWKRERVTSAFSQLDAMIQGGKLQDVCQGTFRWLGGGNPMCLVIHDVGSTKYEVQDTGDQSWFAMTFYCRDRSAREVAFNDMWDYVRGRDPNARLSASRFDFTHRGQDGFCDLTQAGHTDVFCRVKLGPTVTLGPAP
jgi:hypothetical protein